MDKKKRYGTNHNQILHKAIPKGTLSIMINSMQKFKFFQAN